LILDQTRFLEYGGWIVPWNKKNLFTYVMKLDHVSRLYAFGQLWDLKRDYGKMTHMEC